MTSEVLKVWGRQEVKKKDGSTVKLVFQDLPLARLEEAIDFTIKYMVKDEACHKASGVYKNEEAVQEYRMVITHIFKGDPPHVTVCCVDDGSQNGGELAGMSTLMLMKQNDSMYHFIKQFPVETKEMQYLFATAHVMEEATNISKQFNGHYHGAGVVVQPDYRGLGIANEFIRIRRLICEEKNVPMTAAWMTAVGTQRASEKNNWKVHAELEPENLGNQCGITFENTAIVFKYMYTTKD